MQYSKVSFCHIASALYSCLGIQKKIIWGGGRKLLLHFLGVCFTLSPQWLCSASLVKALCAICPVVGHLCAALSVMVAGFSEIHRKHFPQVEQTLSKEVLLVSSMPCFHLAPQYILLGVAEALVTPSCKYNQIG